MFILQLSQFLGLICCGIGTGASVYISKVDIQVRKSLPLELAATIFPPTFNKTKALQGGMFACGTVFFLVAWLAGGGVLWLVAGLLLLLLLPISLFRNLPIGERLSNPSIDKSAASTKRLLQDWDKFHYIRTVLAVLSLVVSNLAAISR